MTFTPIGLIMVSQGKENNEREDKNMKNNTIYEFEKNGKKYTAAGKNRFEAQADIEIANGIDLNGASFTEIYKLTVVRKGIVK